MADTLVILPVILLTLTTDVIEGEKIKLKYKLIKALHYFFSILTVYVENYQLSITFHHVPGYTARIPIAQKGSIQPQAIIASTTTILFAHHLQESRAIESRESESIGHSNLSLTFHCI